MEGSGGVPLTVLSPGKHVLSGAHFKVCMFMFLVSICITYFPLLQCLVDCFVWIFLF